MKRFIKIICIIFMLGLLLILGINYYVKLSMKKYIVEDNDNLDSDCIIVLGSGIKNNKPSPMLEDRLKMGISLYNNDRSNKIIMSGDHGRDEYDEVNVMKKYAISKGVNSENIFMDHAGFSTYDSIYRAKEIFKAKKVIIVSQRYHLYRALYIAKRLGLDAVGVAAEDIDYSGDNIREFREILARNKDVFKCIIKSKPTYLGDTIPVSGNGDDTNDKDENNEL